MCSDALRPARRVVDAVGMRRLLIIFALLFAFQPLSAQAAGLPANWDKGFNFTTWTPDQYASADGATSLDGLASTGANSVSIMTTWYQPSLSASAMAPDPAKTPTDDSMSTAARRAKAKGLKVVIRPMVDPVSGGGRTLLAPTSTDTWFANYRAMMYHYADLAQAVGADTLSVGLEFRSLTVPAYDQQWRNLIAGVRSRFSGELVYGANWNEYEQIRWWDAVDVIGIDAYFPLSSGATPSEDEIVQRWQSFTDASGVTHRYVDEIGAVAAEFNKPVVFSELGYASAPNNLSQPWEIGNTYSATEQQRAYAATFRAFTDKPWFRGVYIWDWYAHSTWGAVGYPDHSPQGKPARQTLTDWFTGPAPAPTTTTPTTTSRRKPKARLSATASSSALRKARARRRAACLSRLRRSNRRHSLTARQVKLRSRRCGARRSADK